MTELIAWKVAAVSIGIILSAAGIWIARIAGMMIDDNTKLLQRLSRIAALETPKGSATSKKMARIARGEE